MLVNRSFQEMTFYKDQAAKLRVLAKAEKKKQKPNDDVISSSSLRDNKPSKTRDNFLLRQILIFMAIAAIVSVIWSLVQSNKEYRQILETISADSQILKEEMAVLSAKTKGLEDEISLSLKYNQQLVAQLEDINVSTQSIKNRLNTVENERGFLKKQLVTANDKLKSLETAKKDSVAQIQNSVLALKNSIEQLRSKLEEITIAHQKPEVLTNHTPTEGEVVFINKDYRFAVVSLGTNKGLTKGRRLDVFKDNVIIGELEVIEVREEISACDIKMDLSRLEIGNKVRLK